MTNQHDDTENLDRFFAAARATTPEPSAEFFALIVEDAQAQQAALRIPAAPAKRGGVIRQWLDALGGWPAISSLATATVAGIWVGISPPEELSLAAQSYLGLEDASLVIDMSANSALGLPEDAL